MPLHDFECGQCGCQFEELHKANEAVLCPYCGDVAKELVSPLADYTGQASLTVQYVTRNSPYKDSHIQKLPNNDTGFLRKQITKEDKHGNRIS